MDSAHHLKEVLGKTLSGTWATKLRGDFLKRLFLRGKVLQRQAQETLRRQFVLDQFRNDFPAQQNVGQSYERHLCKLLGHGISEPARSVHENMRGARQCG